MGFLSGSYNRVWRSVGLSDADNRGVLIRFFIGFVSALGRLPSLDESKKGVVGFLGGREKAITEGEVVSAYSRLVNTLPFLKIVEGRADIVENKVLDNSSDADYKDGKKKVLSPLETIKALLPIIKEKGIKVVPVGNIETPTKATPKKATPKKAKKATPKN
jgi:hypothetical protein